MANSKISALTSATTPLAGTETLPIVQGGATVKATVANITGAGLYPGSFTTLASTGNTTLGDASTDTVRVNGYVGVGAAPTASTSVYIASTALAGTTQSGFHSNITGTSAATSNILGFYASPNTAASAFTVTNLAGFRVDSAAIGAGSTITNQHGLYISNLTAGTNNYGITSLVSSGTNKWNIYASGTAANYFAGNVQFAAGTAAAPALTRFGDENTGIFFPAADTIAFSEGGAEAMRLDSSGNLGLGVTPSAWVSGARALQMDSYSAFFESSVGRTVVSFNAYEYAVGGYKYLLTDAATMAQQVSGTHRWFNAPSGTAGDVITFTERMRLDSSGNLGIGTSSPNASAILDVQSTTKGVRMPNMTTTQKNAIASPAAGLMVFDTTLAKLCVYSGIAWETITSI